MYINSIYFNDTLHPGDSALVAIFSFDIKLRSLHCNKHQMLHGKWDAWSEALIPRIDKGYDYSEDTKDETFLTQRTRIHKAKLKEKSKSEFG